MASVIKDDGTEVRIVVSLWMCLIFLDQVTGDISLYNDDGQVIVEVFGFHVRFMDTITERDVSRSRISCSFLFFFLYVD